MTGRHRKEVESSSSFWGFVNKPVRVVATAAAAVSLPVVILGVAASIPDARATDRPAQLRPVADRSVTNQRFLSKLSAIGINVAGRESALEMVAATGAASHTTDADLEQSVRALFPDIDQVEAEKFVFQVRRAWPGEHEVDTDGDGR